MRGSGKSPAVPLALVLAFCVFSGCGQSDSVSGPVPQIDPSHATIILPSSGGWPDITFSHQMHADLMNGDCLTCHNHTGVRDSTIWSCRSCHSRNDPEDLCLNDAVGHGCWMVQCKKCHDTLAVDPSPNCIDCHQ